MPADSVFARWFDAGALYREGIPGEVTTALTAFPGVRAEVAAKLAWVGARRVLEVGPGSLPLAPGATRLDLAPRFLGAEAAAPRAAAGGVQGDIRRAPFRDDAFDLVVAADVLTHIPPADRPRALAEMARVAPRVLLFNPEPGTPEVEGSAVPTSEVVRALVKGGATVQQRDFRARAEGREDFTMALVYAVRLGAPLRVER